MPPTLTKPDSATLTKGSRVKVKNKGKGTIHESERKSRESPPKRQFLLAAKLRQKINIKIRANKNKAITHKAKIRVKKAKPKNCIHDEFC